MVDIDSVTVIATVTNIDLKKHHDMAIPSVYKYCRPLMILCFCLGQFAVVCVTVERSDLLRYHRFSISLVGLSFEVGTYSIAVLWSYITGNIGDLIVNLKFLFYITGYMMGNAMFVWFYLGSKNIVQVLIAVDRMRETLIMMPSHTRPRISTPQGHLWYVVALFMYLLTVVYALLLSFTTDNFKICDFIFLLVFGNALSLQTVTLISLGSCCSLVLEDSVQTWLTNRTEFVPPKKSVKRFCELILNQFGFVKDVNRALGKHVLVILVVRIADLLLGILYSAKTDYAEAKYVIVIVWWTNLFAYLFFSVDHTSTKMDRLVLEVINSKLTYHGISKREAARVKVLITQLETQPKFTAAGFIELTPELFLSLLVVAIDYLIVLWQNKTFIRILLGSKDLNALANITMYGQ